MPRVLEVGGEWLEGGDLKMEMEMEMGGSCIKPRTSGLQPQSSTLAFKTAFRRIPRCLLRGASFHVPQEVLPGVELLTGSRFCIGLSGTELRLRPSLTQCIDTFSDVPIQAVFPPEPAIGFEGFGDAAERFEGAAEHIENLHDVFFRCAG